MGVLCPFLLRAAKEIDARFFQFLRSLFDHAWNRVRDYRDYGRGSHFGGIHGVGVHEARHWHSRAYGGMV